MAEPVIEARGLTKRYGALTAVDGIDLRIGRGEIFGVLGPNGAGKTTTILMLLGLTDKTDGTVHVLGYDPARQPLQVKRRVGYMPDSVGFYDNMTARQNLRYTARLAGLDRAEAETRIAEGLERVKLSPVADRKVGTFSHGMRRRLGLAEIVLKKAEVAILDEPTSGLDPQATHEILELIRDLKAHNVAVVLSSHLLDQVQRICDRVALFNHGKIALLGTVPELAQKVLGGGHTTVVEAEGTNLSAALAGIPGARRIVPGDGGIFRVLADRDLRADVARRVTEAGGRLLRLNVEEPSLDAIYRSYFEAASRAA
ncbi:MAG TPA: ABC transporter ATP-binding protein [Alphaproteobacteria bacterium]